VLPLSTKHYSTKSFFRPGPTGGAYIAPPDPLPVLRALLPRERSRGEEGNERDRPPLSQIPKYDPLLPIALLYNRILSVGYVPHDWLAVVIIPVHKKGIY